MKEFAIKHSYFSGFLVFIIVTSFGIALGFQILEWRDYTGLDAGYFILLAMMASFLIGVFSRLFAALFLQKKKDELA